MDSGTMETLGLDVCHFMTEFQFCKISLLQHTLGHFQLDMLMFTMYNFQTLQEHSTCGIISQLNN